MRRLNKAFTLVELLVVIAIMAVLVSILVPALGRAKSQAQRLLCVTNMRNQYMSQIMYAEDNEGRFAEHSDCTPDYVQCTTDPSGHSDVFRSLKNSPYLEDSKILICPALRKIDPGYGRTDGWIVEGYGGWDYEQNTNWNGVEPGFVNIVYMWFANYRYAWGGSLGDEMLFHYTTYWFGEVVTVNETPWPRKTSECKESAGFISHRISRSPHIFWDISHGGSLDGYADEMDFEANSEAEDSPTCYADGHVETRMKTEIWPRACTPDNLTPDNPNGARGAYAEFYY